MEFKQKEAEGMKTIIMAVLFSFIVSSGCADLKVIFGLPEDQDSSTTTEEGGR